eukprot:CAMPEP_0198259548 /NCGR_PEP_ID=MMETSP1447-20131203/8711_1 /TAXON_ID=420782 /ORGANISM="Chaetoceros dichaeta, Strain CCMP1751" /LENGTH=148 /DNA_ID=CAMNT_0043946967 /DNA_START=99 /DNA_END=545 /DNA_ORIENTATION=-
MNRRYNGSSSAPNSNGSRHNNNNSNMHRSKGNGYDPERGGGGGGGGLSASDMNANIMEQQNNERISELGEQVARLKGLTINIGAEVEEQNKLLDQMGQGFSSTGDLLSGSLKRIGTMLESGGAKHMLYMVGFVVLVMVSLYWLMKSKG